MCRKVKAQIEAEFNRRRVQLDQDKNLEN